MKAQLEIGSTNDPQEQQADQTADNIMRMPESPFVQRKCASCEHEEEKVSRKTEPFIQKQGNGLEGGTASESVTNQINSSRGGGNRMSENTLNFMESRFNTGFSGVKIHTDSNAVQMSRELNAQAFTVGNDIYFNEGKYSPESASGKHLLAHELTHTVQQGGGIDRKIQRFCTPVSVCTAPIPGSSSQFGTSEASRERASRRRRRSMSPSRATSTSHSGLASQVEIFVNSQNPTLLTHVRGIFIDQDLSSGTGALTENCSDWESEALPSGTHLPRTSGATSCIFIHGDLNQQALEFNNTNNPTIAGISREFWRIRTMTIFTHEVQHILFDTATHTAPSGILSPNCDFNSVSHELSELNAIMSEFPTIFRAIPSGAAVTHPLNVVLDRWFDRSINNGSESIRGIITAMGCICECDEIKKWVEQTFNFVSSSWTTTEKNTFNVTMKSKFSTWPL
jgi:hypothetical protein